MFVAASAAYYGIGQREMKTKKVRGDRKLAFTAPRLYMNRHTYIYMRLFWKVKFPPPLSNVGSDSSALFSKHLLV